MRSDSFQHFTGRTLKLRVPLYTAAGAPVTGVPQGDLAFTLYKPSGSGIIPVANYLHLGNGIYTLDISDLQFDEGPALYELLVRYVGALPTPPEHLYFYINVLSDDAVVILSFATVEGLGLSVRIPMFTTEGVPVTGLSISDFIVRIGKNSDPLVPPSSISLIEDPDALGSGIYVLQVSAADLLDVGKYVISLEYTGAVPVPVEPWININVTVASPTRQVRSISVTHLKDTAMYLGLGLFNSGGVPYLAATLGMTTVDVLKPDGTLSANLPWNSFVNEGNGMYRVSLNASNFDQDGRYVLNVHSLSDVQPVFYFVEIGMHSGRQVRMTTLQHALGQIANLGLGLFDSAGLPVIGSLTGDTTVDILKPDGTLLSSLAWNTFVEEGNGLYRASLSAGYFDQLGTYTVNVYAPSVDIQSVIYYLEVPASSIDDATVVYDVVRDAQGKTVSNVTVNVFEAGTANLLFTTRSDYRGEYAIPLASVTPVLLVDIELIPIGAATYRRENVSLT